MKGRILLIITLVIAMSMVIGDVSLMAQEPAQKPASKRKLEKEKRQMLAFTRTDSLLKGRKFVFQAEFNQGSETRFVVVDSLYGEVQNGMRNNLRGRITQYELEKDPKRKNLTVSMKMRGTMQTADVFINVGPTGNGQATVKSEFPGNFTIYGKIVTFEDAFIHQGPSHQVH